MITTNQGVQSIHGRSLTAAAACVAHAATPKEQTGATLLTTTAAVGHGCAPPRPLPDLEPRRGCTLRAANSVAMIREPLQLSHPRWYVGTSPLGRHNSCPVSQANMDNAPEPYP